MGENFRGIKDTPMRILHIFLKNIYDQLYYFSQFLRKNIHNFFNFCIYLRIL